LYGNCDTFLYLGGNEQSTHKYVSELLGKETIDTNTYGKSTGHSGSYSTNYQNAGRELLTADEVIMLDNDLAILFIRGERPIIDRKYDILKHPRIRLTPDGGAEEYHHGQVTHSIATITFDYDFSDIQEMDNDEEFILLNSEEIEEIQKKNTHTAM